MELFFFPCSNNNAYDHFLNTIENEVSLEDLNGIGQAVIDNIRNNVGDHFRLWGVKSGNNRTSTWEKISEGDIGVFYREKKIEGTCKIKYRFQNSEIANKLWGRDLDGQTWDDLIFFENYKELGVDSTKADGSLLMYQGFSRVGDNNKARVLELIGEEDNNAPVGSVNTQTSPPASNSLNAIIDDALKYHKQIVLTGAPGTGKTFGAKKYVENNTSADRSKYEFVQFHPSYDYSDFVEGLRPVVLDGFSNDEPTFVRIDGLFKRFCRKIVMKNYEDFKHQDASAVEYETFIDDYSKLEKNDGSSTKYYFVIDEINRADLSKVFGELMYGLEESYRGIDHRIQTQYKNLQTYTINSSGTGELLSFDCFKGGFFIPKNLYIIGTMNDIDKSVDAFDFALRRRFEWIEIIANDVAESALTEMFPSAGSPQIADLVSKIQTLNKVISDEGQMFGLSESYHIGHAYFSKIDFSDPNSLEKVFNRNIVSILKEYTRGRDSESVNAFIEKCATSLLVQYIR